MDCRTHNYSIMETDREGKFVRFKVVLGGTSLFKMNHGHHAVSIAWSVAFIGALE